MFQNLTMLFPYFDIMPPGGAIIFWWLLAVTIFGNEFWVGEAPPSASMAEFTAEAGIYT